MITSILLSIIAAASAVNLGAVLYTAYKYGDVSPLVIIGNLLSNGIVIYLSIKFAWVRVPVAILAIISEVAAFAMLALFKSSDAGILARYWRAKMGLAGSVKFANKTLEEAVESGS